MRSMKDDGLSGILWSGNRYLDFTGNRSKWKTCQQTGMGRQHRKQPEHMGRKCSRCRNGNSREAGYLTFCIQKGWNSSRKGRNFGTWLSDLGSCFGRIRWNLSAYRRYTESDGRKRDLLQCLWWKQLENGRNDPFCSRHICSEIYQRKAVLYQRQKDTLCGKWKNSADCMQRYAGRCTGFYGNNLWWKWHDSCMVWIEIWWICLYDSISGRCKMDRTICGSSAGRPVCGTSAYRGKWCVIAGIPAGHYRKWGAVWTEVKNDSFGSRSEADGKQYRWSTLCRCRNAYRL